MPELSAAASSTVSAELRALAKSQLAVIDLPEAHAAALIAAELGGPNAERPIVWTDAESELLVYPHATRVRFAPGFVFVELMVATDQTGRAKLLFPFKVGASPNEAVLMAVTEGQPRGDTRLAARWGEPATTIVWHAVLRAGQALLARRRLKQPMTMVVSTRWAGCSASWRHSPWMWTTCAPTTRAWAASPRRRTCRC